ncbi:MAG: hypothetical protein ACK5AL_00325 [Planctomycetota bacterium]|jgi:hypothetical protein
MAKYGSVGLIDATWFRRPDRARRARRGNAWDLPPIGGSMLGVATCGGCSAAIAASAST